MRDKPAMQRDILALLYIRQLRSDGGIQLAPARKLQHGISVVLVAVDDIFHRP